MKIFYCLAIVLLIAFNVSAQKNIIIRIVVDKDQQLPVEFTTVSLHHLKDTSLVTGGVTDAEGKFSISVAEAGNYFLNFKFLGYATFSTPPYNLTNSKNLDLGKIELNADAKMLMK